MADTEKKKGFKWRFIAKALLSLVWIYLMAAVAHGPAYSAAQTPAKEGGFWPKEATGWKVTEGPEEYGPTTAYAYMDGAAELFNAYNMKKLTVVRYGKAKRPDIMLEIYEMASPADASGLFSFESDDPAADIGQGSEFGGGLLRFWKGRYFVSVYGDGQGADVEAATLSLGSLVAGSIQETGRPAAILDLLPGGEAPFRRDRTWYLHSYILLNQRFFISNSNILKLAGDVEVALGQYGSGKERAHVLVAKYPARTEADSAFLSFRKEYMPNGEGKHVVRTKNGRWTAAVKEGVYIAAVFDARDKAFALEMMKAAFAALPKEAK